MPVNVSPIVKVRRAAPWPLPEPLPESAGDESSVIEGMLEGACPSELRPEWFVGLGRRLIAMTILCMWQDRRLIIPTGRFPILTVAYANAYRICDAISCDRTWPCTSTTVTQELRLVMDAGSCGAHLDYHVERLREFAERRRIADLADRLSVTARSRRRGWDDTLVELQLLASASRSMFLLSADGGEVCDERN